MQDVGRSREEFVAGFWLPIGSMLYGAAPTLDLEL